MYKITIPAVLRHYIAGEPFITLSSTSGNVADLLIRLSKDSPQLAEHLLDDQCRLLPYVTLFHNGQHLPADQHDILLGQHDALSLKMAISGG